MAQIHEHPPFAGPVFNTFISEFIKLVRHTSMVGKRTIRVLEVGAGNGRLTACLGQALLDANLDRGFYVEYIATDPLFSDAQVLLGQQYLLRRSISMSLSASRSFSLRVSILLLLLMSCIK